MGPDECQSKMVLTQFSKTIFDRFDLFISHFVTHFLLHAIAHTIKDWARCCPSHVNDGFQWVGHQRTSCVCVVDGGRASLLGPRMVGTINNPLKGATNHLSCVPKHKNIY